MYKADINGEGFFFLILPTESKPSYSDTVNLNNLRGICYHLDSRGKKFCRVKGLNEMTGNIMRLLLWSVKHTFFDMVMTTDRCWLKWDVNISDQLIDDRKNIQHFIGLLMKLKDSVDDWTCNFIDSQISWRQRRLILGVYVSGSFLSLCQYNHIVDIRGLSLLMT